MEEIAFSSFNRSQLPCFYCAHNIHTIQNVIQIRVDWRSEIELRKLESVVHQRNLDEEYCNHANMHNIS